MAAVREEQNGYLTAAIHFFWEEMDTSKKNILTKLPFGAGKQSKGKNEELYVFPK